MSYKKQIAPIFASNCNGCHTSKTPQSKLSTDNFASLLVGGGRGKCVLPGQSKTSLLLQYVDGRKTPRMPIGGSLKPAEIGLIAKWIDEGAKSDGEPNAAVSTAPLFKPKAGILSPITAMCWSLDGKRIYVGAYQEVRIVDPLSGQLIQTLTGHADTIRSLTISPNGLLLAAAGGFSGQSGEVKIWSLPDFKLVKSIEGHTDCILGVTFSADNLRIATTSYDKTVRIWDVATGKSTMELKDHADAVYAAAYASKGKYLVTASADKSIRVWDGVTGKRLYSLSGTQEPILSVSASSTADTIATCGVEKVIRLWNLKADGGTNTRTLSSLPDTLTDVNISPDGKWVAAACADGQIGIWNVENGSNVRTIKSSKEGNLSVRFSPNNEFISVGGFDGILTIWKTSDGSKLIPLPTPKQPGS